MVHHHRRDSARGGFFHPAGECISRSVLRFYEKWSLLLYVLKRYRDLLRGFMLAASDVIGERRLSRRLRCSPASRRAFRRAAVSVVDYWQFLLVFNLADPDRAPALWALSGRDAGGGAGARQSGGEGGRVRGAHRPRLDVPALYTRLLAVRDPPDGAARGGRHRQRPTPPRKDCLRASGPGDHRAPHPSLRGPHARRRAPLPPGRDAWPALRSGGDRREIRRSSPGMASPPAGCPSSAIGSGCTSSCSPTAVARSRSSPPACGRSWGVESGFGFWARGSRRGRKGCGSMSSAGCRSSRRCGGEECRTATGPRGV